MKTGAHWLLAAGALFMIGFGVKTALVPMHTWLPDAHSQAPSGISAMLSGVVIEAGLMALLRALACLSAGASPCLGQSAAGLRRAQYAGGQSDGAAPDAGQAPAGLFQLSHVGYMLIGFGVGWPTACSNGAAGGFFHLFNHAMMKGLAFLAAGALLYALHISHADPTTRWCWTI